MMAEAQERAARWAEARNLLCVRLDNIGDVLMTGPAVRALRRGGPELGGPRVTLLTSKAGASVARLMPEVDEAILYEAPWVKASALRGDSASDRAMADQLRSRGFDAVVIFTVYSQNPLPSALLCFLADIPLRMAYCRENPCQLLTDWVPETEPHDAVRHEVRRQLDLVAAVGCGTADERLTLRVSEAADEATAMLLDRVGIDTGGPWAVLHPGSTAASRRYPPELFASAADGLARLGWQVVLTGDAHERPLVEHVRGAMHHTAASLAGMLRLEELAAVIQSAPVLISNNTAAAHIAAAVGTPVVDLYALTNPQHTPWGVSHRVLFHDVPCRYCYKSVCPEGHHGCLGLVSPDEVVRAALEIARPPRIARSRRTSALSS
jgi:lipopolysaccharide heptosyltransferase II